VVAQPERAANAQATSAILDDVNFIICSLFLMRAEV
jgi:hypothetical protein